MNSSFQLIRLLLGYSSLALAWVIPDLIPPWNTFYREAFAVLAVILLWPWQGLRVWPARLCWFWFALAGMVLLQSITHDLALGDVLLGLLIALFACMASSMGAQAALLQSGTNPGRSRQRPIESWCLVLLAAALANAVIGFAQWQGFAQSIVMVQSTGRVYGNLAQPNHFATLMVIALAALVYLDRQSRVRGAWLFLAAGTLVIALAASESRTGALSFTLLAIGATVAGRSNGARASLRWLAPSLILFWLLSLNWSWVSAMTGGSVTRMGIGLNSSSRFEIWQQGIEALTLQPWLGYGWLHAGEAQNAVAHYLGGAPNVDHMHLLFLDLLVWFGIPMGGLLALACFAWVISVTRSTLNPKADNDSFFYLLIILPTAVHSMLEYPYAYTYFVLVFAFFAGAVEQALGKTTNVSHFGCRAIIASAAIATLFSGWIFLEYLQVEEDYRALRLEQVFFTRPDQLHKFHAPPVLLTQFRDLVASQRRDANAPEEYKSLEVARRVTMRFPLLRTHQHYYLALLRSGHCEEAQRQRMVIASLFGKFGTDSADRDQGIFGIKTNCPR